jgi:hypothetical protein
MHVDRQTFERSFLYLGPGYDIQPLLRFTHLCDTFLYANLYLDRGPVEAWYDAAFAEARDIEVLGKEVTADLDPLTAFDLGPKPCTNVFDMFGMDHREYMDYVMAFRAARDQERYAITWRLRRRSTGRLLTLHFFTGEALEAYVALSHGGRYAPQVLCTIETGVLEAPRGVMNRFFSVPDREQPLLWIRGFEPTGLPLDDRDRRDALNPVGEFCVRALPFNHRWSCGDSYPTQTTDERHCYGFVTEDTADRLKQAAWNPRFRGGRHSFTTDGIERGLAALGAADVAVMPQRLVERFASGSDRVHAWETILRLGGHGAGDEFIAAGEQVAALRAFLDRLAVPADAVVHVVPWCREDENDPYREALATLRQRTITYCPALADLLDLKGVTARRPEPPIFQILDRLNVSSSDDGRQFRDTTRLDAIEGFLREAGSPWAVQASGPLFRLYGRSDMPRAPHPVLVSSHADSSYGSHFHELILATWEFLGTLDNSITNAAVLETMLGDLLPADALVAFTGDEENESQGAADVAACLRGEGREPRAVVVLDVTDDRFYGRPFTVENWFAKGRLGLPTTESAFRRHVLGAFDFLVPTVPHEDAWQDESWRYEKEGVHVVSLCVPTAPAEPRTRDNDWMHSAAGVRVRADLLDAYREALVSLLSHLNGVGTATESW